MQFTMTMNSYEFKQTVSITQGDVEYLGDVANLTKQFLNAVGYDYVKAVIIVKNDGDEVPSE